MGLVAEEGFRGEGDIPERDGHTLGVRQRARSSEYDTVVVAWQQMTFSGCSKTHPYNMKGSGLYTYGGKEGREREHQLLCCCCCCCLLCCSGVLLCRVG